MKSAMPPQPTPFDPVTGDVLPEFRDAYLLGQLAPPVAQAVEEQIKTSAVQTGVILGRYHELSAEARVQGRTLVAPVWVQQQLQFQVSTSKAGPLRRPEALLRQS